MQRRPACTLSTQVTSKKAPCTIQVESWSVLGLIIVKVLNKAKSDALGANSGLPAPPSFMHYSLVDRSKRRR